MKKLFLTFIPLLSLVLLYGCSPNVVLKDETRPHDVVLSSFRVHVDDFNEDAFYGGRFANLFLSVGRTSPFTADLDLVHQTFDKQQNQNIKAQLDSTYSVIRDKLAQENLNLLPAQTLKGKTRYDEYGYPIDAKQSQAFKKANLSLKVDMYLDEDNIIRNYEYDDNYQSLYTPRLTIVMKLVNKEGKTIWNQQSVAYSNRDVIINDWVAGGMQDLTIEETPSLAHIVRRALNHILKQPEVKKA